MVVLLAVPGRRAGAMETIAHQAIVKNDEQFKRVIGAGLTIVSALGLLNI